jgi:hypothetical protein
MAILSRDQIFKASDLVTRTVAVPEWGGSVSVRALTGTERDAFEAAFIRFDGKGNKLAPNLRNIRARLVAMSVVDENGNRMFADNDVDALSSKSASALQRVFEAAQELSGLSNSDVEEMAKNSEIVPSDVSTSR